LVARAQLARGGRSPAAAVLVVVHGRHHAVEGGASQLAGPLPPHRGQRPDRPLLDARASRPDAQRMPPAGGGPAGGKVCGTIGIVDNAPTEATSQFDLAVQRAQTTAGDCDPDAAIARFASAI
jgi:hypothetical protein